MNIQNIDSRKLTTIAFLIGITITDNLNSTEQAAIGNFIMLIGQTICTNSSFYFNNDWQNNINSGNINSVSKDTLMKTSNIINDEINKL